MKKFSKLLAVLLVVALIASMSVLLAACDKDQGNDIEPVVATDVTASYSMTADEVESTLVLNSTKSTFTLTTGDNSVDGTYTAAVKGYANLYYKNFNNGVAENLYSTVELVTAEAGDSYKVVATGNADDDYGTRSVVDKSGKTITLTGEVTEIINLWPACTGGFFAMGAADLLVGTATVAANDWTSFFFEDAASIPTLRGTNASVEAIANLDPDLVIVHPSNAATLQPQLEAVGIAAMNINFSDYDSMKASYTILGTVLGGVFKDRLEAWCEEVDEDLEYVRNLTKDLTADQKPVVYYISGQGYTDDVTLLTTTFSGAGTTNIMKDWCESAGGQWASSLLELSTTSATAEAVLELNPDIIICGGPFQHVAVDRLNTINGWKDLDAVENEKVFTNPYVCFNWERFGIEALLQIKNTLKIVHPELAEDINMVTEVKDFYKKYTNVELTDEQAQYILDGKTPTGEKYNADKI